MAFITTMRYLNNKVLMNNCPVLFVYKRDWSKLETRRQNETLQTTALLDRIENFEYSWRSVE